MAHPQAILRGSSGHKYPQRGSAGEPCARARMPAVLTRGAVAGPGMVESLGVSTGGAEARGRGA